MWFLIGTVSRWALFAGLLTAFGAVTFRLAVLSKDAAVGSNDPESAFDPSRAAARIGRLAMWVVAIGAVGRLAAEVVVFRDPFEPLSAEVGLLVGQTSWGRAWLGQIAATVIGLVAFAMAGARGHVAGLGWALGAAGVILLAYTPAFSGHAAGAEHYVTAAISADVLHVMAGGAWLGTLAVMTGVVLSGRRTETPISRDRLIGWIAAFSPLALGSAVVIAVTGVFGAWLHLDAVSALWSDPYGRRLSLKLLVLMMIVGSGAYNWKRSRGRVRTAGHPPSLPASVMIELGAGLALLLITAVLVTTPPPAH